MKAKQLIEDNVARHELVERLLQESTSYYLFNPYPIKDLIKDAKQVGFTLTPNKDGDYSFSDGTDVVWIDSWADAERTMVSGFTRYGASDPTFAEEFFGDIADEHSISDMAEEVMAAGMTTVEQVLTKWPNISPRIAQIVLDFGTPDDGMDMGEALEDEEQSTPSLER